MHLPDSPYLGKACTTPYSRTDLVRRTVWTMVQATLFRWSPRPWHRWRARLLCLFGADISEPSQVVIFPTAKITLPWLLTLAPRAMIGREVRVYNLARITLEYGANVSQHTHLCAGSHDFTRWDMPLIARPITIGANAWIAADVFIGPGVTIGELAIIGARSVVIKDQPAHMICAGHPCRPLKTRPDPV
jgi:putative colanic acid biosynthesis acetyltransferase WcaF